MGSAAWIAYSVECFPYTESEMLVTGAYVPATAVAPVLAIRLAPAVQVAVKTFGSWMQITAVFVGTNAPAIKYALADYVWRPKTKQQRV